MTSRTERKTKRMEVGHTGELILVLSVYQILSMSDFHHLLVTSSSHISLTATSPLTSYHITADQTKGPRRRRSPTPTPLLQLPTSKLTVLRPPRPSIITVLRYPRPLYSQLRSVHTLEKCNRIRSIESENKTRNYENNFSFQHYAERVFTVLSTRYLACNIK